MIKYLFFSSPWLSVDAAVEKVYRKMLDKKQNKINTIVLI
jgi:hypothetical protein